LTDVAGLIMSLRNNNEHGIAYFIFSVPHCFCEKPLGSNV